MYKSPERVNTEELASLVGQEFVTDQDPLERRIHLTILRNFDYQTEFGPSYGNRLNRYKNALRRYEAGFLKIAPDPKVLQLIQYRPKDPYYQYCVNAHLLFETPYQKSMREFKRYYQDLRETEKTRRYFEKKSNVETNNQAKKKTDQDIARIARI